MEHLRRGSGWSWPGFVTVSRQHLRRIGWAGACGTLGAAVALLACSKTRERATDGRNLPASTPIASAIPTATTSGATVDAESDGRSVASLDAGPCRTLTWSDDDWNAPPQSFEGRVELIEGVDPEQGKGTFAVLRLDAPICSTIRNTPQSEVMLRVLSGTTDAGVTIVAGNRVRVYGQPRSMEIYARPLRAVLVYVRRVEPLL
jgi:hypothetical protein